MARDADRLKLIKLIHVAKRELAMDDDTYRALMRNTAGLDGATSCVELTVPKLRLLLDQLKARGFRVRPTSRSRPAQSRPLANDPQSKLIRHLWLELHSAGAVRDPSERALGRFVAGMTDVESLQWLSSNQASQVIERLKKWLARLPQSPGDGDE